MINQIKTVLNSEKGMSIVNLLFFLSLLIRSVGVVFIAYIGWIVYLVYSMKQTSSKAVKVISGILIAFAVSMIVGNLYFLIQAM